LKRRIQRDADEHAGREAASAGQCQREAGIVSSCPPAQSSGACCALQNAKNGKTNDLCHVQDEKQQKAQQREAEASSSAASDPLLATKTAFDSKERKRALQKES